jgi:hypothetical protein
MGAKLLDRRHTILARITNGDPKFDEWRNLQFVKRPPIHRGDEMGMEINSERHGYAGPTAKNMGIEFSSR